MNPLNEIQYFTKLNQLILQNCENISKNSVETEKENILTRNSSINEKDLLGEPFILELKKIGNELCDSLRWKTRQVLANYNYSKKLSSSPSTETTVVTVDIIPENIDIESERIENLNRIIEKEISNKIKLKSEQLDISIKREESNDTNSKTDNFQKDKFPTIVNPDYILPKCASDYIEESLSKYASVPTQELAKKYEEKECQIDKKMSEPIEVQTESTDVIETILGRSNLSYLNYDCDLASLESKRKISLKVSTDDDKAELQIVLCNQESSEFENAEDELSVNKELNKIIKVGNRLFNVINYRNLITHKYKLEIFDVTPKVFATESERIFINPSAKALDKSTSYTYRKSFRSDRRMKIIPRYKSAFSPTVINSANISNLLTKNIPAPTTAVYSSLGDFDHDPLHKKSGNLITYRKQQK